ncbi:MAG: Na(+)/H(+) antiporter subunit B [Xanthomonadales bacterium]|nr:Na(+)/H(+) antiporter subunit B [Xanthomonadales bacterium]
MKHHLVLRVVAKLLIPLILLFALYVQFHGEYSPGGGFQAGVVFGSAMILYALIYGVADALAVMSASVLKRLAALGVLIYGGVGVWALMAGGNFLDYNALANNPKTGQHLGIILIELGVGITVASVMMIIFFAFAGRGRRG